MLLSYVGITRSVIKVIKRESNILSNVVIQKRRYAAKTAIAKVTTVVVVFLCCYTPLVGFILYHVIYPRAAENETTRIIVIAALSANSCINPFIYAMRFKECQREMLKLFCFWNKEQMSSIEYISKVKVAPYLGNK